MPPDKDVEAPTTAAAFTISMLGAAYRPRAAGVEKFNMPAGLAGRGDALGRGAHL